VPGRPRVLHTPGHTGGHCAFVLEERGALIAGDLLCTLNPLVGHGEPWSDGVGAAVERVRELGPT
jgi:glyoxylase-like metal-dependent hydrolase (beta-lactamase superfamily II)